MPEQLHCRPEQVSDRGAEGDGTYEKIPWSARVGVGEMLVVHPHDRRVELRRAVGGQLVPVQPGSDGELVSEVLGITLRR